MALSELFQLSERPGNSGPARTKDAASPRFGMLCAQGALISAVIAATDGQFTGAVASATPAVKALAFQPVVLWGLFAGCGVALAYCFTSSPETLAAFMRARSRVGYFPAQIAFALAIIAGSQAFPPIAVIDWTVLSMAKAYYLASPLLWSGFLATTLLIVLPPGFLAQAPQLANMRLLGGGGFVGLCSWRAYEALGFPGSAWLTSLSLSMAGQFSELVGRPIVPDGHNHLGWPTFRAGDLSVVIAPTCAGSEGLLLCTGLLLLLVVVERQGLQLGRALALVVAAALSMFVINALRIAALLYIGSTWSAEVAVKGFHTNFGLVTLVVISTAYGFAIRRLAATGALALSVTSAAAAARVHAAPSAAGRVGDDESRLLLPLIAMIASTLVVGLASGNFNWLYPVTTIVTVAALWRIGLRKSVGQLEFGAAPVIAGIVVYVIWIWLIPADDRASSAFAQALFSAPASGVAAWLFFRVVGSSAVVPLAEELAFRAFLLPRFANWLSRAVPPVMAWGTAVIGTSLLFGVVHQHMVAGTIAGIAYCLVYLHRRNRLDAVLAHATTNLMLCVQALALGDWSYL